MFIVHLLSRACRCPRRKGIKNIPYKITQVTLDNGLKIVSIPFDSPGIVAYYTVVRTGSRNEIEPGKSGFAHFFEHMMFRGTEKYPKDKFNRAFEIDRRR